jgi:hypothetical protein
VVVCWRSRLPSCSCVQMTSAAAADRKSPATPSARLAALCIALPDVTKPVVRLIDEYLRRLPPAELIRELSRAISPELSVDAVRTTPALVSVSAAAPAPTSWTCPSYCSGVTVSTFCKRSHLRSLLKDQCIDNPESVSVARSDLSEPLRLLRDAMLRNDTVTPALKRLLAEDDSALCCVRPTLPLALWCAVLLACRMVSAPTKSWALGAQRSQRFWRSSRCVEFASLRDFFD